MKSIYYNISPLCIWLVELTHFDSATLRYTEKTDKKMRRNFGREFYEQGCWVTIEDFLAQLQQTKTEFCLPGKYTPIKRELIMEVLCAFELNLQLLSDIKALISDSTSFAIDDLLAAPQKPSIEPHHESEEKLSTNYHVFFNQITPTPEHLLRAASNSPPLNR